MSHQLPLFFSSRLSPVLVVGGSTSAARKVEWLLRCQVSVTVVAAHAGDVVQSLALDGAIDLLSSFDAINNMARFRFAVVAEDDTARETLAAQRLRAAGVLVNILNSPLDSDFVLPSLVDRFPVGVAISTGGVMPAIARWVRSRLEAALPPALGEMSVLASQWRARAQEMIPAVHQRQIFWERMLEGRFADLALSGDMKGAESALETALDRLDLPSQGEVALVGAGPGDPELLTLRAFRLIRAADVVLYDRLVAPKILDLCRTDAERIHVGKARSEHTVPQDEINAMLVRYAKAGKRVVRLKGGDPFIFGRGGEELESIVAAGLPFQVVPGVTAAAGCAAYAGIPLTHRDYSQSVRFVTGHLKDNSCDLPWAEFVHEGQTLVFYMGLVGLPEIARQLMAHGMAGTMPVALVSRGTTPEQRVVTGTLATIAQQIADDEIKAPTLIIIGQVVQLRDKLDWLSQRRDDTPVN